MELQHGCGISRRWSVLSVKTISRHLAQNVKHRATTVFPYKASATTIFIYTALRDGFQRGKKTARYAGQSGIRKTDSLKILESVDF